MREKLKWLMEEWVLPLAILAWVIWVVVKLS